MIGISWSYNWPSRRNWLMGAPPQDDLQDRRRDPHRGERLDQVTSTAVKYDTDVVRSNRVSRRERHALKQEYADKVKEKDLATSNVGAVMQAIDGVFFTGGEDVRPVSVQRFPRRKRTRARCLSPDEEINATRDISDYMLSSRAGYCLEKDMLPDVRSLPRRAGDVHCFPAARLSSLISPNYYKRTRERP